VKIVPTRSYLRHAAKLFSEKERQTMEDAIAVNPEQWPVIPGTGGLRKARVPRPGMGKRGGARTIYFYWVGKSVLLLLHVYAKSVQEDMSADQKKTLVQLRNEFMEHYRD
jgi:hypothetical protein